MPGKDSGPITPVVRQDRSTAPDDARPNADPDLDALSRELGGDGTIVDRFVRDYLHLLDERLPDIRRFLRTRNHEAAHVALLSLESTTAMFGVPHAVAEIAALRGAVGRKSPEELLEELTDVVAVVHGLRARLVIELLRRTAVRLAPDQGCDSASR